MNRSAYGKRMADAQHLLVEESERLACALDLPHELVSGLQPATNRQELRSLLQIEAVGRLLKAAADAIDKTSLLLESEKYAVDDARKEAEGNEVTDESSISDQSNVEAVGDVGDELPPPVVEEPVVEEKTVRKSSSRSKKRGATK